MITSAMTGIAAYRMPEEPDLPTNEATWQPVPARAVLLIHDMQKYFVGMFPADEAPVTELINNVRLLRQAAVDLGIPVMYTAQPGGMTRAERGLLHDFWGPGMDKDPNHRQILDELAPCAGDTVLTKWRYSAFARTDLEDRLRAHGRDQLIICGVYAHVGCLMTACDAFTRDLQSFLVADAVADFSPHYHELALQYAAERCAVTMSTNDLLTRLSGGAQR